MVASFSYCTGQVDQQITRSLYCQFAAHEALIPAFPFPATETTITHQSSLRGTRETICRRSQPPRSAIRSSTAHNFSICTYFCNNSPYPQLVSGLRLIVPSG